jgi:hypothetical protein
MENGVWFGVRSDVRCAQLKIPCELVVVVVVVSLGVVVAIKSTDFAG